MPPPDAGDSADPEGTPTLMTPEAAMVALAGMLPEACGVKAGDWTRTNPSIGVWALLD